VSSGVFAYGSHCSGSQQIEELKRYKYVSRCGKTSTSPLMGTRFAARALLELEGNKAWERIRESNGNDQAISEE